MDVENQLLARLPQSDRTRLASCVDDVRLDPMQVLYDVGDVVRHVYFPTSGVVSVLAPLKARALVEIAAIGHEGFVGLPAFLDVPTVANRFTVLLGGSALRMRIDHFREHTQPGSALHGIVQHYTYSFLVQVCQTAACHAIHSMEKRCCRWLLALHDRVAATEFLVTQESLAQRLCVRRATITAIARKLQADGLIRYRRGRMAIVDRPGLEACACECYAIMRASYDGMPQ